MLEVKLSSLRVQDLRNALALFPGDYHVTLVEADEDKEVSGFHLQVQEGSTSDGPGHMQISPIYKHRGGMAFRDVL